jgi:glycosyltransferase involved in cell wall biosynthesis
VNAALRIPDDPRPGVNLVGPLDTGSGLGEAARMLGRTLDRAGIPFVAIPCTDSPRGRPEASEWPSSDSAPFDINVLCLQPDQLSAFAAGSGARLVARRVNVGMWFWESSVLAPRYRPALRLLDAVWVFSEYVRGVLASETSAPVRAVPASVTERRVDPLPRETLGLPPDGFLFLALLDLVSASRKNPEAVIEAYRTAFTPDSGARLVLKTINGHDRKARRLRELQAATAGRDDIAIVDGYVSEQERDAIIAACDCFVSLHRSEGLGLPLLEAMSLGKPVIATGYSGNLDFMDDEGSYLVPFRFVPVPEGEPTHSAGAVWAEPSVEIASSLLRRVFDAPDEARAVGERGRRTVLARLSPERAAEVVLAEIEAVRRHANPDERTRRESIVDATVALAGDPVLAGYPGRGPVALVRRLLLRALWPQLSQQLRRDDAILQGLTDVERAVASLEARLPAGDGNGSLQLSANRVGASSSSSGPA